MERHSRRFVVLATALIALAASGTAWGKCGPSPKGNPSVREYREVVPTACGPKAPKGGDEGTTTLPPAVVKKLGTGGDADILKELATSKKQGAPPLVRGKEPERNLARNRNPLSASVGAATNGSDARLIALLAVIGAAAVAVGLVAVYRRRLGR